MTLNQIIGFFLNLLSDLLVFFGLFFGKKPISNNSFDLLLFFHNDPGRI
tara:strand:+ start:28989 stop:29135 length:147 start_codon:yes stop_codon:yes gene_type:complete